MEEAWLAFGECDTPVKRPEYRPYDVQVSTEMLHQYTRALPILMLQSHGLELMQICWYYSRIVKVASDGLIVSSTKLVLYLGFGVRKESIPPYSHVSREKNQQIFTRKEV